MEGGMLMMRLPIGFRFRPTDEELVVYYLRRKALSLPLPANVIHSFDDVFVSHPSSFPGDLAEKRRYYFCKGTTANINLTANGCGFWKTNARVKQIVATSCTDGRTHLVGTKKVWTFYQRSGSHGWSRTPWIMHHYQLPQSTQKLLDGEKQGWGVFKLFKRKTRPTNKAVKNLNGIVSGGIVLPTIIDFNVEVNNNSCDSGPPPQASSPSSPTTEDGMVGSDSGTGSGTGLAKEEELTKGQASYSSN